MTKARDLKVGDLVRFKDAEYQPNITNVYRDFYGHLCFVEDLLVHDWEAGGGEHDCVAVKSIATGETTICWATRLETVKRGK